jgi:hypothetical protein
MKILMALGVLLMGGTAMADWGEWRSRDQQREQARFDLQQRLDRCHSERCRWRARREFRRDLARIDQGRFYRF